MGNLEAFKLKEKIKLSYLKHRGNTLEISRELNLPIDYIEKIVTKFKKQEDRDVSVLIANTLMSHILLGVQSRITHLMEMLKSLEDTEKPLLSICCESPVKSIPDTKTKKNRYQCLACFVSDCEVSEFPEVSIYNIKKEILEQLREEDKALIEMADKMGYTGKEINPPPPVYKPNILVIGGKDEQIMKKIENLPQIEKDKLAMELKKEILQLDKEMEEDGKKLSTEETKSPDTL